MKHRIPAGLLVALLLVASLSACREQQPDPATPPPDPQTGDQH